MHTIERLATMQIRRSEQSYKVPQRPYERVLYKGTTFETLVTFNPEQAPANPPPPRVVRIMERAID